MKIYWKRLLWSIFVLLYTMLFFYNCLRPYPNWTIAYIYTMSLIIWLTVEYYRKRLFFQSGIIPYQLYRWYFRALVALFFYSSFVIGLSTIIWWHRFKINLYPFIPIIGLVIFIFSIYIRERSKLLSNELSALSKFYLSIALLSISIALGYGSWFLLIYTLVIGLPLLFWGYNYEKRIVIEYQAFIQKKKVDKKKYNKLWKDFIAHKTKTS